MMAKFPALPLWTDAFLADTTSLSTEEIGAYMLLLMTAWRRPDCDLPLDDIFLAKVVRCDIRAWRQRLRPVMEPFFTAGGAQDYPTWTQKRLQKERNFVEHLSAKQRCIAHSRWNKNKDLADARAMPERCHGDAPIPIPPIVPQKEKTESAPLRCVLEPNFTIEPYPIPPYTFPEFAMEGRHTWPSDTEVVEELTEELGPPASDQEKAEWLADCHAMRLAGYIFSRDVLQSLWHLETKPARIGACAEQALRYLAEFKKFKEAGGLTGAH